MLPLPAGRSMTAFSIKLPVDRGMPSGRSWPGTVRRGTDQPPATRTDRSRPKEDMKKTIDVELRAAGPSIRCSVWFVYKIFVLYPRDFSHDLHQQ